MTKDEALKLALEALEDIGDEWGFTSQRTVPKRKEAITTIKEVLAQPEQKPVALKRGECWPEDVMKMWDFYRKEIANGNTGSEPRDWFESLAEMRLVDTTPPQRKPLSENEIKHLWYEACQTNLELTSQLIVHLARNIEAAHGIKEKNSA